MLKKKTRILVTHAIDFLHLADRVIVLKDGEISVEGDYETVNKSPIVQEIIAIHNKNQTEKDEAFKKNPQEDSAGGKKSEAESSGKDSDGSEGLKMNRRKSSTT